MNRVLIYGTSGAAMNIRRETTMSEEKEIKVKSLQKALEILG